MHAYCIRQRSGYYRTQLIQVGKDDGENVDLTSGNYDNGDKEKIPPFNDDSDIETRSSNENRKMPDCLIDVAGRETESDVIQVESDQSEGLDPDQCSLFVYRKGRIVTAKNA